METTQLLGNLTLAAAAIYAARYLAGKLDETQTRLFETMSATLAKHFELLGRVEASLGNCEKRSARLS
jgi:hypothetical protein